MADYYARIDTGWDCCVCGTWGTVMGDGFSWCLKHWELYDLGQGQTIRQMRDNLTKTELAIKKGNVAYVSRD
jgi:hypothetical protein